MSDSYPKEQTDLMHKLLESKIDTNYKEILLAIKQQEHTHKEFAKTMKDGFEQVAKQQKQLDENQKFTNGKLKKIIVALVAVGAFALGTGLESITELIKLLV